MKKQCIKTFKQIWKNKEGVQKEFFYRVAVVRDTIDYKYRIMNLDELSIWKEWKFDTFNQAKDFIIKHPLCVEREN